MCIRYMENSIFLSKFCRNNSLQVDLMTGKWKEKERKATKQKREIRESEKDRKRINQYSSYEKVQTVAVRPQLNIKLPLSIQLLRVLNENSIYGA